LKALHGCGEIASLKFANTLRIVSVCHQVTATRHANTRQSNRGEKWGDASGDLFFSVWQHDFAPSHKRWPKMPSIPTNRARL
jgi:hypothetical protein